MPPPTPTRLLSVLPPLRGFLGLAPRVAELDEAFAGAVQVIPVRDFDPVFARDHTLIAFKQKRFRVMFRYSGLLSPQPLA